jgi:hypothetical protein
MNDLMKVVKELLTQYDNYGTVSEKIMDELEEAYECSIFKTSSVLNSELGLGDLNFPEHAPTETVVYEAGAALTDAQHNDEF